MKGKTAIQLIDSCREKAKIYISLGLLIIMSVFLLLDKKNIVICSSFSVINSNFSSIPKLKLWFGIDPRCCGWKGRAKQKRCLAFLKNPLTDKNNHTLVNY